MNHLIRDTLIGTMTISSIIWLAWYMRIVQVTRFASTDFDRIVVYLAPVVCVFVLPLIILEWEVADPQKWTISMHGHCAVAIYLLSIVAHALPCLGLSPRDDVAERRNHRAGWAIGGALLGATLACGSAAGSILATEHRFFQATPSDELLSSTFVGLLSIVVFFLLWGAFEFLTGASEAITVDRQGGVAFRLAAMALALGWLIGKSTLPLLLNPSVPKLLLLLGGPILLLFGSTLTELKWKRKVEKSGDGPKPTDIAIALVYWSGAGIWTFATR